MSNFHTNDPSRNGTCFSLHDTTEAQTADAAPPAGGTIQRPGTFAGLDSVFSGEPQKLWNRLR